MWFRLMYELTEDFILSDIVIVNLGSLFCCSYMETSCFILIFYKASLLFAQIKQNLSEHPFEVIAVDCASRIEAEEVVVAYVECSPKFVG